MESVRRKRGSLLDGQQLFPVEKQQVNYSPDKVTHLI